MGLSALNFPVSSTYVCYVSLIALSKIQFKASKSFKKRFLLLTFFFLLLEFKRRFAFYSVSKELHWMS